MAGTVLLHVGTPKTGTSYLQDVLFRNRVRLRLRGINYPGGRFDAHFLAALDLLGLRWGGLEAEALGAWDELAGSVRAMPGTAIVSHEILATATPAQVSRALESLGHGHGTEVHVVLSVRDLARQIPAEWQENVKHRARLPYAEFLARIQDPARASRIGSWFWAVQEVPDILDRWGRDLPPDRVHVVTVPPPGRPDVLWTRFSRAFRLDGQELDLGADRVNPSLGVPETALVRRINRRANRDIPPADYRPLVRELLAHQILSQRTGSPRLALPPDLHPWVTSLSETWIEEIGRRGYDVVGDLADLLPGPPAERYADPDHPRERQVADAAIDAIKVLLLETARLRREEEQLRAALEHAERHRLRSRVVRAFDSSSVGRGVLKVYRAARGRSSRSA